MFVRSSNERANLTISAALFVLALHVRYFLNLSGYLSLTPFAIPYSLTGFKVLIAALRRNLNGEPFNEYLLVTIITLGGFALGT